MHRISGWLKRSAYFLILVPGTLFPVGCANFGNVMTEPQAKLQALKVIQTTPDAIRLAAVLAIQNPNPLDLQIGRLEYRLRLKQATVLTGSMASLPLVKNQRGQTLEIPLVLKTESLAGFLQGQPAGGWAFQFSGRAFAENEWVSSPLQFFEEGTLVLPAVLQARLEGFQNAASGHPQSFILALNNPNAFPVHLRKLAGQLEIEETAYVWQSRTPHLTLAPSQVLRLHVPYTLAEPDHAAPATPGLNHGFPASYWIQGELEFASLQGIITVVIHEKSSDGKKN